MSCNTALDGFQREDGSLDVSKKYSQLMLSSLDNDSLYMRAKDTFKVVFADLELTSKEKAHIVSEHVASMTTSLSSAAMQTALQWSKEERDGAYTLAKVKAETEVAIANAAKTKEEVCLVEKQIALQCANITATVSGSIRDNGTVATYDADGCKPLTLNNDGLKYQQTKQVEAATYQISADTFRKSGVVTMGTDVSDSLYKGLTGDDAGYTNQQSKNAERQRQAYEDSKINHMLNATGVVIGQMMSAEVDPADWLLDNMKSGMDKLLTPNSKTDKPFGS